MFDQRQTAINLSPQHRLSFFPSLLLFQSDPACTQAPPSNLDSTVTVIVQPSRHDEEVRIGSIAARKTPVLAPVTFDNVSRLTMPC